MRRLILPLLTASYFSLSLIFAVLIWRNGGGWGAGVAGLAGALGLPGWVLLPFAADWRWLVGREESPWYPTLRLFRQETPRAWEPVLARVAAELAGPPSPSPARPSRPARGRKR